MWAIFAFFTLIVAQQIRELDSFSFPFEYTAPLYAPYGIFKFGSPAQRVACVLDIGTSDTLAIDTANFNGPTSLDRFCPVPISRDDPLLGQISHVTVPRLPSFDSSKSKSLNFNSSSKSFIWNQYQTVQGLWATDVLGMNGVNWTNYASIGLIDSTNTTSCIIGLGPINGEIVGEIFEDRVVTPSYYNLLELLLSDNMISTRTYSMWFNKTAGRGSVVFGGTDVNKYVGNLTSMAIVSYISSGNLVSHIPGSVLSVGIMFHGISIYYESGDTNHATEEEPVTTVVSMLEVEDYSPYSTLVDEGVIKKTTNVNDSSRAVNASSSSWRPASHLKTSISADLSTLELFSRLPREMVERAAETLGLTYLNDADMFGCSCNAAGMLRFNMSGYHGDMSLQDVLVSASSLNVSDWKMSDGSEVCLFTILPEDSYSYVLGNGILRNMYTFVDLSLNLVSFAPLNQSAIAEEELIKPYEYNDQYYSMNFAPCYSCTSLVKKIEATYITTGQVANQSVFVLTNGVGRKSVQKNSLLLYLFAYLL